MWEEEAILVNFVDIHSKRVYVGLLNKLSDRPMAFLLLLLLLHWIPPNSNSTLQSSIYLSPPEKKKNPMLELHTKLHALTPALASNLRPGSANSASPLLRAALRSLRGLTRSSRNSDLVGHRAFFCSDSDSSGDVVVHVEAKAVDSEAEEVETKSSSAIVSTNPRPEDYLTVSFFFFFFF